MPPTVTFYSYREIGNEVSVDIMKEKDHTTKTSKVVEKMKRKRKTLGTSIPSPNSNGYLHGRFSKMSCFKKKRTVRVSWPFQNPVEQKRLPADENLVQSDGEEEFEEIASTSTFEESSFAKTPAKDKSATAAPRKGEYFVKNTDGAAIEKYSMLYRNRLHNGEDMDDDSGDESSSRPHILITDRWKQDYNNGVQMLVKPDELPSFETGDFQIKLVPKSGFKLPKKLISIDDPSSSSPYVSPEKYSFFNPRELRLYQGDSMDMAFIENLNATRSTKNGFNWLDGSTFLDIMNKLEIDAYKNIHQILLKPLHSPASRDIDAIDDEAPCDVCRMLDHDDEDKMVFCDGCNVCVHMSCYGLTELPAGEWLCLKCAFCFGANPPCILCPTIGGAMKCTKLRDRWAHVVCALWLPECRFGDIEKREPIMAIEEIPDERWQMKCSVCDTRQGACIQCVHKGCSTAFHVTCALRSEFTMKIETDPTDPNEDRIHMVSMCKKHSSNLPSVIPSEETSSTEANEHLKKLEKYFYMYADYDKIAKILKLPQLMVSDVYEYWKQKRMQNDGKPLIVNPQDNIVIDPEMISLVLPSTSQTPQPVKGPKTVNVLEARRLHLKKVRAAIDMDRNMLTMCLRREKLKRQALKAERMIVLELAEFATRNVISHRASESLVEIIEQMMSPCEVRKANAEVTSKKTASYLSSTIARLDKQADVLASELKWERTELPLINFVEENIRANGRSVVVGVQKPPLKFAPAEVEDQLVGSLETPKTVKKTRKRRTDLSSFSSGLQSAAKRQCLSEANPVKRNFRRSKLTLIESTD